LGYLQRKFLDEVERVRELLELSRTEILKLNSTEVIKQKTTVQRSYDAFGRVLQQTETIDDLKTNTELHYVQYAFGYSENAMSLQLMASDPAATTDYKIFRRFVYGPSGVLAVDQASLPSSSGSGSSGRTDTAWYLYDLYGESLTIGMADDSDSSILEYRHFLFGERGDISIALGSTDAVWILLQYSGKASGMMLSRIPMMQARRWSNAAREDIYHNVAV
jgi:hypothetical protein